eukprot:5295940-Ditylum_brightwellii.AAC.1
MDRTNKHKTPTASTTILAKGVDGEEKREDWNYRVMIGMMNFRETPKMPEISNATHKCARFCKSPNASHKSAVKQIVRYLIRAKNSRAYGLILKPDKNKGFKVYVDASFGGD